MHETSTLLKWATQQPICCILDSCGYKDKYGKYDKLIAIGNSCDHIDFGDQNTLDILDKAIENPNNQWLFGFLGYDIKNEIEDLTSKNSNELAFPDIYFFTARVVIGVTGGSYKLLYGQLPNNLLLSNTPTQPTCFNTALEIKASFTKDAYIRQIEALRQHLYDGDAYEVNFCQNFRVDNIVMDSFKFYETLIKENPTPFAGFLKFEDKSIISASPERFLQRHHNRLVSQPIKGTAKRSSDVTTDRQFKTSLAQSPKERAENIMIVDLVRNDLARCAKAKSVRVEALCEIHSYPTVHQMISTISAEVYPSTTLSAILRSTFPMGSMTGAPKIAAMQLIDKYENTKRGPYSGSLGYISPTGDFDFNVLIRSAYYNASKKHLSFQTGGAITYASEAEKEYEESILKAKSIINTLKVLE